MAEPSPFAHYDEASKTFVDGANPVWKQLCMKKFDWVRRVMEQGIKEATPAGLAARGDKHEMDGVHERSLQQYILDTQFGEFGVDTVRSERVYDDYTAAFTWRDLYHKLCFEQMLANFDKLLDFGVFYDYVNKLGDSVQVLRVRTLNKTKLKSNHYWIMVLMTKLTKLRVVKIHGSSNAYVGPDFYKFLLKGMNYMAKDGRQLQKIELNALLGVSSSSGDYLYPCLKPHQNLVSLDFSNQVISTEDAKAIGKVLADFRQVRELNLTNANLNTTTTKEIADGLMRAKQLEVLILHRNPAMSAKVSTIIYNLAFSPKIRHIDISELGASNADTAEALFKLIKISGAIETLNLRNTGVEQHLTQDFWKALGEN